MKKRSKITKIFMLSCSANWSHAVARAKKITLLTIARFCKSISGMI